MNVRMLTDRVGQRSHLEEGKVYDLPDAQAEELLRLGHAELFAGKVEPVEPAAAEAFVRSKPPAIPPEPSRKAKETPPDSDAAAPKRPPIKTNPKKPKPPPVTAGAKKKGGRDARPV